MACLALFGDIFGLFVSGWVFRGQDALGSVLAVRVILGLIVNATYAEHLRSEGWTDKQDEFRFIPPLNED